MIRMSIFCKLYNIDIFRFLPLVLPKICCTQEYTKIEYTRTVEIPFLQQIISDTCYIYIKS